ncbi:MAG: hypothetical protein ACTSUD_11255 [Alphaproteobacteria bacterium]
MAGKQQKKIVLSIVVPMFSEAEGIGVFLERVEPVAEAAVAPLRQDYEIVCVDDGPSRRYPRRCAALQDRLRRT